MKLSLRKPININAISSFFHESFVRLFKSSPPSPRNDEFFSTTNGREKFSSNRDRSRADLAEKFNGGRGRKRVGGGAQSIKSRRGRDRARVRVIRDNTQPFNYLPRP